MGLLIFCPDIDGRENGLSTLVKNKLFEHNCLYRMISESASKNCFPN